MTQPIDETTLPEVIDADVPEVIIADPELGVIQAQTVNPEDLGEAIDEAVKDYTEKTDDTNTLQDNNK